MVGAVKEALRLYPSAPNWFPRVVPPEGKIIDGVFVPGNMDVTSNAMIIQRDPDFLLVFLFFLFFVVRFQ